MITNILLILYDLIGLLIELSLNYLSSYKLNRSSIIFAQYNENIKLGP